MKKQNYGFTLIELLVALVVVGILASFAYSSYSDSIVKAQVTSAINLTEQIRSRAAQYYLETGTPPPNLAAINAGLPTDTANKWVIQVDVANGQVVATFRGVPEAHNDIAASTIAMEMYADNNSNVAYLCNGVTPPGGLTKVSTGTTVPTVAVEFLPSSCAP